MNKTERKIIGMALYDWIQGEERNGIKTKNSIIARKLRAEIYGEIPEGC